MPPNPFLNGPCLLVCIVCMNSILKPDQAGISALTTLLHTANWHPRASWSQHWHAGIVAEQTCPGRMQDTSFPAGGRSSKAKML